MKVAIFGMGYVGISAAACLTSRGHTVVGVDVSEQKVQAIRQGKSPIVEPGVPELLADASKSGLLWATTSAEEALRDAEIAFVCVGTPSGADGSHNMTFIVEVTRQIAAACRERQKVLTVAYRSTIKPGTIENVVLPLFRSAVGDGFKSIVEVAYNPEFLREGSAVFDYFNPPKIVVGTILAEPSARMRSIYEGIDAPYFEVNVRDSEIIKFVDNTWHALKVAYANEVGRICHKLGVDATTVHEIFKIDTKLNISDYYTRPGAPFGGSCLPKDLRAFKAIASEAEVACSVIKSITDSNEQHKEFQFERVRPYLKDGASVLLVGIAFKADTDDLRESPSLDLARRLLRAGADLSIFDPAVSAENLLGQNLGYAYSKLPALSSLLVTREQVQGRLFDVVLVSHGKQMGAKVEGKKVIDLNRITA